MSINLSQRKAFAWTAAAALVLVSVAIGVTINPQSHADAGAPTSGTPVCNQPILNSPYSYNGAPATITTSGTAGLPTFGSSGTDFPHATSIVLIPAGNNTAASQAGDYQVNNTIFYFEPGTHVIQSVMYAGDNSVYIGGYNSTDGEAVINGENGGTVSGDGGNLLELPASGNVNADDTWDYLTIENYTSSEQSSVMGNENGGGPVNGDTYEYDTIGPNEYGYVGDNSPPATGQNNGGGYAINAGNNTTIEYDCLTQNAQGAYNDGGVDDTISHNEISRNGLGEYPENSNNPKACGCSGGGKLFQTVNANFTYNYIHDNYNVGIWLDFDNTGANISYNYIASNWNSGIMYEGSYNANISDNTLIGNGWASDGAWPSGGAYSCYNNISCTNGLGPIDGAGGGFPYAAIYLPNSGANSNLSTITIPDCSSNCSVTSNYSGQFLVENNDLINNFGNIMVYTDTNRYPGNIDNDSSCSIPLGPLNQPNNSTYYAQTKELTTTSDTTVSGNAVMSTNGTDEVCPNYGGTQSNSFSAASDVTKAPSVGMAVFDINSGKYLGDVAGVSSVNAFTLNNSPGNESGASLLLSAYGGCGPADYYNGGPGVASGSPSANYWDNCIWGSRNVMVSGNTFTMDSDSVTGCSVVNMCGYMSDVAFNAGVPKLVQFFDQYANLTAHASGGLGNVWSDNTYNWTGSGGNGTWGFWAGTQGTKVSQAVWQAAPNSQDAGSTFGNPPTSSTPTPTPTPTATSTSSPSPKSGDLNNDGQVNIFDLSILLSAWGTTNPAIEANLGRTGPVDIFDLSIMLSNWGT